MKVVINKRKVVVTGPRGTLSRDLSHIPIDLRKISKDKIRVELWFGYRKEIASIRTVISIIRNLIIGVTKGYLYKMRLVAAHFPMNATIDDAGSDIVIRNFLGERRQRRIQALEGVKIVKSDDVKDQLELSGNDVNNVSLTGNFQYFYISCLNPTSMSC